MRFFFAAIAALTFAACRTTEPSSISSTAGSGSGAGTDPATLTEDPNATPTLHPHSSPTPNLDPTPTLNPIPDDAGPPRKRSPGGFANVDPTDDYLVGPPDREPDCDGALLSLGVTFQRASLPVHTLKKPKITCGAPEVVTYIHGPANIRYNAAPLLSCGMALALATWERIIQEEARARFHSDVVRIDQMGTYSCREVAAYPGTVSEHAYANAIDIMRFILANGKVVEVVRDFDLGAGEPRSPKAFSYARFLGARTTRIFSRTCSRLSSTGTTTITSTWILSRYRLDGTRPNSAP